jgi:hypothetical protein
VNRSTRHLMIEAFRRIQIQAAQCETTTRAIVPQDIGPTSHERTRELLKLREEAERVAVAAALVLKSIDDHIGADDVLGRAKFPRAKPLSASTKKDP